MGPVSRNKSGTDQHTIDMFGGFELPPVNNGVVDIAFKASRADGYPLWTENKSKLIQHYVRYFLYVTRHGTYIDGFAGPQVEEYNDECWSAKKVLEIEPGWMRRFILCDMDSGQVSRLERLRDERRRAGDMRKIEIYGGDFNQTIDSILAPGAIGKKEATFCLLDQRTLELKWETVRKIAAYKTETSKIEQFYFLAVGWLQRSIQSLKDDRKLRDWWGRDDVDVVLNTRQSDAIARLFQHRFVDELGYAAALAWPIYERAADSGLGKVMYYMIHATDHEEAPKLMNRASKAVILAPEPMDHLQKTFDEAGFDFKLEPDSPQ